MVIEIEGMDDVIKNFDNYVKYNSRATRDAINGAFGVANTTALREAKKDWQGMLLRDFKKHIKTKKATVSDHTASFEIKSNPIPLIEFKGRWSPKWSGASYKLKGRQRKLKSSFIRKGRGGKEQIFKRSSRFKNKIIPRYAITPTSMFTTQGVEADKLFISTFQENFPRYYANQLKRFGIV